MWFVSFIIVVSRTAALMFFIIQRGRVCMLSTNAECTTCIARFDFTGSYECKFTVTPGINAFRCTTATGNDNKR